MGELVRDHVALERVLVPVLEVARLGAVLAGLVVLQAQVVVVRADGQQQVVVGEVARAEQAVGLAHEVAVELDLLVLGLEVGGVVGHDVEEDRAGRAGVERDALEVLAGEHRRIDQGLQRHALEAHLGPVRRRRAQRAAVLPRGRQLQAGVHVDARGEMAGRIQQRALPFHVQQVAAHERVAAGGLLRQQLLELEVQARDAGGHVHAQREEVVRVARPRQALAGRLDAQARQALELVGWRVVAGNPLRIQQQHPPGPHGDRLVDAQHLVVDVGGVDVQPDRAGVGRVLRRRQWEGAGAEGQRQQGADAGQQGERGLQDGLLGTARRRGRAAFRVLTIRQAGAVSQECALQQTAICTGKGHPSRFSLASAAAVPCSTGFSGFSIAIHHASMAV